MPHPVVIIGAGPAGLGAALAHGDDAVVLEATSEVGGLCGAVELGGAVFDLGGHSFHTPHPAIRKLVFEALPMEEQRREAWCFSQGQLIPYPFQKHFDKLQDERVREACRLGLQAARPTRPASNFEEHLEQRFGPGIVEHFLRPYNEKLWGKDLTRLSADWTQERVPGPAGAAEQFLAQGGQRTPLQDGTSVAYPAQGGFGEIFRALARRVPRLKLGQSVVAIDPLRRTVTTADGQSYGWQQLVSTMPLPQLLQLLPDVPLRIRQAVGRLQALPVTLVMIAGSGRLEPSIQRIYSAGSEIPAHKIVLNHNSSDYLRGLPQHGIQAEVAGRRAETDAELTAKVIDGLRQLGFGDFLKTAQRTRVIRLALGYPVPTHDRAETVAQAKDWLAARGIHTLGRFGEWAYINCDEALHRGLCVGQQLSGRSAA